VKLRTSKGKTNRSGSRIPQTQNNYTDEEEVAKEKEWILQNKRNAKKRKMDTSSNTSKQANPEQPMQQSNCEAAKPMKPPPIIIYQVRDYDIIYRYLNTKLEHKYKITLLNNGDLKLNVDTEDLYRTASKMSTEAQFIWSTYENKPDSYGSLSRSFIVHVLQTR
jgi:TFIIF-interacting CTD phosphatase-like protein